MLASTKPFVFLTDVEVDMVLIMENYCNRGISIITDSYMSGHYMTSYLRKELAKNLTFRFQHSIIVQKEQEWIVMKYMRNTNCMYDDGSGGSGRKSIALEQIQNLFVITAGSYGVAMFVVVLELSSKCSLSDSLIVSITYAFYFRLCKVSAHIFRNF